MDVIEGKGYTLIVGYDWQEMWPEIKSVEPTVLQFKEYENVKYKLLEINTNESLRTIEIYQMFYMIHNCNTIDFRPNYFTRNEFNFIARRFEFAEEMVIEYFNKKFAILLIELQFLSVGEIRICRYQHLILSTSAYITSKYPINVKCHTAEIKTSILCLKLHHAQKTNDTY